MQPNQITQQSSEQFTPPTINNDQSKSKKSLVLYIVTSIVFVTFVSYGVYYWQQNEAKNDKQALEQRVSELEKNSETTTKAIDNNGDLVDTKDNQVINILDLEKVSLGDNIAGMTLTEISSFGERMNMYNSESDYDVKMTESNLYAEFHGLKTVSGGYSYVVESALYNTEMIIFTPDVDNNNLPPALNNDTKHNFIISNIEMFKDMVGITEKTDKKGDVSIIIAQYNLVSYPSDAGIDSAIVVGIE